VDVFVLGTSAEWFKIEKCVSQKETLIINTCQQRGLWEKQLANFPNRINLLNADYKGLTTNRSAAFWFFKSAFSSYSIFSKLKKEEQEIRIIVQGDTLSTFVGTLVARLNRLDVVHIEAGLRSNNVFNPFPEEIIRRVVDRLSKILFVPNLESEINLRNSRGTIVNTGGNTFVDSIPTMNLHSVEYISGAKYVLISLHRQELLSSRKKFMGTLECINLGLTNMEKVIILDTQVMSKYPELSKWLLDRKFIVKEKLTRVEFLSLACNAEFVLTDSGGTQEEMALYGVPTIIHRRFTERNDGLGQNVVVSGFQEKLLFDFFREYTKYRRPPMNVINSPSKIIRDYLDKHEQH
jgi:UDP-N-acetylglucosamine 2-epimerase (non-hydrolysing)